MARAYDMIIEFEDEPDLTIPEITVEEALDFMEEYPNATSYYLTSLTQKDFL